MPSPQEILSDPKFLGLPVGEQLKVMRTVDPAFASLPAKEQGTVIAKSKLKSFGYDKIGQDQTPKVGFMGRLKEDVKAIPGTLKTFADITSPTSSAKDKAAAAVSLAGPNVAEYAKSQDKSKSGVERFGHGLAAAMPGVGPLAARAGEDIGNRDLGAGAADILELAGPKMASEFVQGFREGWEEAGPKAKSMKRGANAPWRKFPVSPETPAPDATPIPATETPSGRKPGGPQPQAASTAGKLPRWHMIRDQVRQSTGDASSIKSELPSGRKVGGPKTPAPGAGTTVDASKVGESEQSAAELMKAVGITPSEVAKATPEQWKMIEQQVGVSFDRQKAVEHLAKISEAKPAAKPSPASGVQSATPKTPRPSPGGAKVESTMTPEARAARAEEHATKIAARLKKDGVRELPAITDDAAWKLIEQQTGTEASPKVRAAAIEKATALWKADQGDLQSRREAYFSQPPEK